MRATASELPPRASSPLATRHRFLAWAVVAGPPGALLAQALAQGLAQRGAERTLHAGVGWSTLAWALVLAPILEEIVFRGGLQHGLERTRWGRAAWLPGLSAGNLLTSAVFAAAHLGVASTAMALATFLPSLVLGRLKQACEPSLLPAIAVHAWYNLCFITAARFLFIHS